MNKSEMKKTSEQTDTIVEILEKLRYELLDNGEENLAELVEDELQLNVKWDSFDTLGETMDKIADACKTLKEANMCDEVTDILWDMGLYSASTKKSKMKKDYDGEEDEVVEEYRGVEIWLFAEDGVYGIVDDEGEVIESYDDIESVKDYIDHIVPYDASAKKSYTPDYKDFRSMVGSIRNTRDHNKVFKE